MKCIYLSDTHIGGNDGEGYYMQPRYLRKFQTLIDCLKQYIVTCGDIDCVIHGGDMVNRATPESITAAADFFGQLPCPTYLALGNHDLTATDSLNLWLTYAPQFFPQQKFDFKLIIKEVQINIVLSNWGKIPAYWNPKEPHIPWLSPEQLDSLHPREPSCHTQIVVTHTPLFGVPPEQHGGTEPLHSPQGDIRAQLTPHIKDASLVLGAHNHINTLTKDSSRYYATTSAFSEMPFEYKVIEVCRDTISMKTINLYESVPFKGEYNFNETFAQGRARDRGF